MLSLQPGVVFAVQQAPFWVLPLLLELEVLLDVEVVLELEAVEVLVVLLELVELDALLLDDAVDWALLLAAVLLELAASLALELAWLKPPLPVCPVPELTELLWGGAPPKPSSSSSTCAAVAQAPNIKVATAMGAARASSKLNLR